MIILLGICDEVKNCIQVYQCMADIERIYNFPQIFKGGLEPPQKVKKLCFGIIWLFCVTSIYLVLTITQSFYFTNNTKT